MSYINKMHNVVVGASAVTSVAVILAGCSHKRFDCSSGDSLNVCSQHNNCAWVIPLNATTSGLPGHCVASDFCDGKDAADCASSGCFFNATDQNCVLINDIHGNTHHHRPSCSAEEYISSNQTTCVTQCAAREFISSNTTSCVTACNDDEFINLDGRSCVTSCPQHTQGRGNPKTCTPWNDLCHDMPNSQQCKFNKGVTPNAGSVYCIWNGTDSTCNATRQFDKVCPITTSDSDKRSCRGFNAAECKDRWATHQMGYKCMPFTSTGHAFDKIDSDAIGDCSKYDGSEDYCNHQPQCVSASYWNSTSVTLTAEQAGKLKPYLEQGGVNSPPPMFVPWNTDGSPTSKTNSTFIVDPTEPNKLYIKNDGGKNYEFALSLHDIKKFVDWAAQKHKPVDLQLMNIGKKTRTEVPASQFIPNTFQTCILNAADFAPSSEGEYCMLSVTHLWHPAIHVPEEYCTFHKNGQCNSS